MGKPFLHPCTPLILQSPKGTPYAVRKDNSFSYKGNFYSLPYGTYQGRGSKVLLEKADTFLVVYNLKNHELCRHLVRAENGDIDPSKR